MTIFTRKGFDSIIGKGVRIGDVLTVPPGHTLVLDGEFHGKTIDSPKAAPTQRSRLVVNGEVNATSVTVDDLEVTGFLVCDSLIVRGCLRVAEGGRVSATDIAYFDLAIDQTSTVEGKLHKLATTVFTEPKQ